MRFVTHSSEFHSKLATNICVCCTVGLSSSHRWLCAELHNEAIYGERLQLPAQHCITHTYTHTRHTYI